MDSTESQPNPRSPGSGERHRKPSAKLRKLVSEMGLRYRPSSPAEICFHQDKLELLIEDLIDLPDHLLERAIPDLCREKPFMPRASDIIARCQAYLGGSKDEARADLVEMNLKLRRDNAGAYDDGVRWYRDPGGALKLGHPPAFSPPCTVADARRILREEGVSSPFLLEVLANIERGERKAA